MKVVRVERLGDEEAVTLPGEFRLGVDEVELTRFGDAVFIRPVREAAQSWDGLHRAVAMGLTADCVEAALEKQEEQHRPELDKLFP